MTKAEKLLAARCDRKAAGRAVEVAEEKWSSEWAECANPFEAWRQHSSAAKQKERARVMNPLASSRKLVSELARKPKRESKFTSQ